METASEIANQVLNRLNEAFEARVFESINKSPRNLQRVTLALSSERLETDPFVINFPFKALFVEDATDTDTYIYVKPHAQDSGQGFKKVGYNDQLLFGDGISKAYIHWPAQSGKSLTLVVAVDMDFRSGRQISQNAGGVSLNDGSSFSTSVVSLSAGAATLVAASNANRKVAYIKNISGASVWRGGSAVTNAGATLGLEEVSGEKIEWRNTSALYLYSIGGGPVVVEEHE